MLENLVIIGALLRFFRDIPRTTVRSAVGIGSLEAVLQDQVTRIGISGFESLGGSQFRTSSHLAIHFRSPIDSY